MSPTSFRSIRLWLTRLRLVIGGGTRHEVDEELQFHLERQVEANMAAGMPPAQARREAVISFGGIERAREECREQRPGFQAETLLQDVRYAVRGFRRNPAFTLTVIATLALGIGATTAVFSVVDRVLFRSLPYGQDDRLVSIGLSQPLEKQEFMLGGFFFEWQHGQKPFSAMTFERGVDTCNLTEANPVHLICASVAQNFLPTLGVSPLIGRNFLPEEDTPEGPKAVLISDGLWQSRYNRDPEVLDKQVVLDSHVTRIVGVLPRNFEMPRMQAADVLVPARLREADAHSSNAGLGLPLWAFARLKPGLSIQQSRDEMQPLFLHTQQWIPAELRKEFHLQVRSVRDRQMQEVYLLAWVLLAAVIAVLLIACANVASLFSARGAAREREWAVRSALGASRGRLVRQTLTEAILLAVGGTVAGCVLAVMLLQVFVAIAPSGLPFLSKAQVDLRIVLFAAVLSLICAGLFGIAPAIHQPELASLTARLSRSAAHARLRRVLVATQIGISVVLLCGASLLMKSFRNLESQSLGMQTRSVLTVRIPLNGEQYPTGFQEVFLRAEAAFRHIPGVTAVGMTNSLPPGGNGWQNGMRYAEIYVTGHPRPPAGIGGSVVVRTVTPDYFRVLQIPIVLGRGFTEGDRRSTGDLIVLSRLLAARLFPSGSAIGQQIRLGSFAPYLTNNGPVYAVAGVAGEVKNAGLTGQDDPEMYILRTSRHPETWDGHHVFLLETALPVSVLAPWIRNEVAKLDATAPVEIGSLQQDVAKLADRPRFETALLGFFAACGLLMAAIGLYGVIAFVAVQRTQEIGVRMALGATRANILWLIVLEGLPLIGLGGAMGLAAALTATQLLRGMIFQVGPHDPAVYSTAILAIAVVAAIATLIPARSAMKIEPADALRYE